MSEIPSIHLINLDRSTKRLRRFREDNGHLKNIIRVSAADGGALDREALIRSGYISSDLPYSGGTLGCAVSHLKLWEQAVSRDRSMTIFEDDIVVSHQFEKRAREILSAIPEDWDFIQWGYNFNPSYAWVDLGTSRAKLECYGTRNYRDASEFQKFQANEFLPAPMRLLHSFGFQGYSISARGARAALDYCLPLRKRFIEFPGTGVITEAVTLDIALCGLYPTVKAFICIPQLLIPSELESDRLAIDSELPTVGQNATI